MSETKTQGPWLDEPDHDLWYDEATGLPCMIHRGPVGALCGYVAVAPGHPLHGSHYDAPDVDVEVHGGLTYADACQEGGPICHVPREGEPADVWWFGFDCAHSGDLCPGMDRRLFLSSIGEVYRDWAYVRDQVTSLAAQLHSARGEEA